MLHLQRFIEEHDDWRELLSAAPYFLQISEERFGDRNLVLFKYVQSLSDLSNPLVQESRGIILDRDSLAVVSHAFDKFFNHGEPNCHSIDWGSAWVSEKLDGNIVKAVNLDGRLLLSTNGVIDAFKCQLPSQIGCPFRTYGELAMEGFRRLGLDEEALLRLLRPMATHVFELTSPWAQIVVPWDETRIWFIGYRDNISGQESRYFDHPLSKVFDCPRVFPLDSMEACVDAADHLSEDAEGYVVCDGAFRRVKVKSPCYLARHHHARKDAWSATSVVQAIRDGSADDFLSEFPRFRRPYEEVSSAVRGLASRLDGLVRRCRDWIASNSGQNGMDGRLRGLFARWLATDPDGAVFSDVGFKLLDGRISSGMEYLEGMPVSRVVQLLGLHSWVDSVEGGN